MRIITIYLLLLLQKVKAQEFAKTLDVIEVIQIVKQYHPIVKLATIELEKSAANITIAKGNFDPVLTNGTSQKNFTNTNYYNNFSTNLSIPTWYGIDVQMGIENLNGARLNNSATSGQTSFVGVNVPLAKNLLMDKRRAILQQAQIFNTLAKVEQRIIVNDILMEAIDNYWQWVKSYEVYNVMQNNVLVNEKRFAMVKKAFLNGERPAIDTIEALTQLQSFQYLQNEKWLIFQNAGLQLSTFFWTKNNENYILPETIKPDINWEKIATKGVEPLNILIETAEKLHPALQVYPYKLNILEIERKLKFQDLLPKVDFKYNQLGKGYNLFKTAGNTAIFQNNFQYGINVEIPLRFSNGRGNYKIAKLKIEETKLVQGQKTNAIIVKIKTYYNEFANLKTQLVLQNNSYSNYLKLVSAEETKFFNGESSLFLINSRENKALEALEKLIETKVKLNKTVYALQWSAGLLL